MELKGVTKPKTFKLLEKDLYWLLFVGLRLYQFFYHLIILLQPIVYGAFNPEINKGFWKERQVDYLQCGKLRSRSINLIINYIATNYSIRSRLTPKSIRAILVDSRLGRLTSVNKQLRKPRKPKYMVSNHDR